MRENNYRIWDKIFNRMVCDGFAVMASGDPVGHFIEPDVTPNTVRICGEWRGDSNIILMQYVGFKDKNKKKVFEGYIFGGVWGGGYVGWCDECKSFQFIFCNGECAACNGDIQWSELVQDKELEVVGNKYENPELLEK